MPTYPDLPTVRLHPTPELFYRTLHEPLGITSVLDVGSGHGGVFDVGYWNFRPGMLRLETCDLFRCRDTPPQWKVRNGVDVCRLTDFYAPASFDLVQCMEVLEHVACTRRALEQLCKVARKLVMISSADEMHHMGPGQEACERVNPAQRYIAQPRVADLLELGFTVRVEETARRQLVAWRIIT